MIACIVAGQLHFCTVLDTITGSCAKTPHDYPEHTAAFMSQRSVLWYDWQMRTIFELRLADTAGESLYSRPLVESAAAPTCVHLSGQRLLKQLDAGLVLVDLADEGCVAFSDYSSANLNAQLVCAGQWVIRTVPSSAPNAHQYSFFRMDRGCFVAHRRVGTASCLPGVFGDFLFLLSVSDRAPATHYMEVVSTQSHC